jgi:pimeloyl-ACP methyl ester carboxylesterase
VFEALSRDFLLTSVMLYWVTGSIGSTMRYYWENWRDPARLVNDRTPSIPVPTGIAVFPNDLVFVPRRLAEEHTNLTRWTEMPRGGHFAAAEVPDLVVEDHGLPQCVGCAACR